MSWKSPNRGFVAALAVGVLVVFLTACAAKQVMPEAQSMPAGKDFSGVWYSPQFEHMHLQQKGDTVAGIYTYKNGGRIVGEIEGNLLRFEWVEPGDKQKAQRTMRGHGYLQLSTEGDEVLLDGQWGYEENVTGGGPWRAEYVRPLDPEIDALTLEQLRSE
jgi:hypothetical protein